MPSRSRSFSNQMGCSVRKSFIRMCTSQGLSALLVMQEQRHSLDIRAACRRPSLWPHPPRYFRMLRLGCPTAGWPFPGSQSK
jgi:hypothetical protein